MILKIADNHSYSKEELDRLAPYLNRDIEIGDLPEIARRVPICIVAAESDDTHLAVDSPESW